MHPHTLTLESGNVSHYLIRNGVEIGSIRFMDEAEFIVHAVNHHAKLIRALRIMLRHLSPSQEKATTIEIFEAIQTLTLADREGLL